MSIEFYVALFLLVLLLIFFSFANLPDPGIDSNILEMDSSAKIITYADLSLNGNFGNNLFKIASTIGIGKDLKYQVIFPYWKYSDLFINPLPQARISEKQRVIFQDLPKEKSSTSYCILDRNYEGPINVTGYRQLEKYFFNAKRRIRKYFTFKKELVAAVTSYNPQVKENNSIAIHVRRGDFLTTTGFLICSLNYYIKAVEAVALMLKNRKESIGSIIVVTNDASYCSNKLLPKLVKRGFSVSLSYFSNRICDPLGCDNCYPTDQIGDFLTIQLCHHQIIANSTYSWWGAWLNNRQGKIVVAPYPWYDSNYLEAPENTPEMIPSGSILLNIDSGLTI